MSEAEEQEWLAAVASKPLTPAMYRAVRRAKRDGFRSAAIERDYGITHRQLRTILESKPVKQYDPSADLLAEGYAPEEIAGIFSK